MTQAVSSTATSSIDSVPLGPSSSLQLMFAKLQLELAETAKSQAMDRMNAISDSQEEQKLVTELLNEARQAQADAKSSGKATKMPDDMIAYMDEHGLAYDKSSKDHSCTSDQWNVAITSLEGRLDELGSDTQQQMVYIQDYMGQYNSYLQGANTQIANSNQTLVNLARGQ